MPLQLFQFHLTIEVLLSKISIPFGAISKFVIIVEPVVVIPDILSKKASVKFRSKFEKINGKEPNIAILNQEKLLIKMLEVNLIFYRDLNLIKKIIFQK